VIRESLPEDQADLERLCLAQYRRTPWPEDSARATAIHVCLRGQRVVGCVCYRRGLGEIYVANVWVEDGLAGRRAAVELLKDLAAMADAEGTDLTFTAAWWNLGLRRAVERYGCASEDHPGVRSDAVFYRRKAKVGAWVEAV